MKSLLPPSLLILFSTASALAQLRQLSQDEINAKRWAELNTDRIAADADGHGITLSDIRRQVDPIVNQIRSAANTDSEFEQALNQAAQETLRSIAERHLIISEFRESTANLPSHYIDAEIDDTIRRDFSGDRTKFVASLRAAGTTPLAFRKTIEDRIIFEYMVGQVRRSVWDVNPGKIQEYYEKNKETFLRKEQVKLRQITLTQGAAEEPKETGERAKAWADALTHMSKIPEVMKRYQITGKPNQVTTSFADVAELISTDDFARKGGDTGWRNFEDLNESVVKSIRGLKAGQVSSPLQFNIGTTVIYVIIQPEEIRPKGYASVNDPEVLTEIENKVRTSALKDAIQNWLDGIRAKRLVQLR